MDKDLKKGTRIYYNGDMANEEGHGVIKDRVYGGFGTQLEIKMDDGRTFSVPPTAFSEKYLGHGGTRFVTEEAYNIFRQEAADRVMEELEKGKEKKKMALTETEMRKVGAEYHKKPLSDDELDALLEDASREAEKREESDTKELQAHKKWVEIWESKNVDQNNENSIRVYCTQAPDVFGFQIRTFKTIVEPIGRAKGIPRNMIAHVDLTITEVEEILHYMKKQYPNMKPVNTLLLKRF